MEDSMYIAILGRQPAISIAELERLFVHVSWFSAESALVDTPSLITAELGGTQKAGRIVIDMPRANWQAVQRKLIQHYTDAWGAHAGKQTLGISVYGAPIAPREIQKVGITLKRQLRDAGVSVRLVPNEDTALSSATAHHNKLGLSPNKTEILVVFGKNGRVVIAESVGAQNITALAARDQGRPKRDAFVGMLPPKLAQIMVNLGVGTAANPHVAVLDPFCGTGVILQEALLKGYGVYGSDLNPKMIDFTKVNLDWLQKTHHIDGVVRAIRQADATTAHWPEAKDLSSVICEAYLGQPFSAPPSPTKLAEVRRTCNAIIGSFLKNISKQLPSGTPLCIAVPAWRSQQGDIVHLPLIDDIESFGVKRYEFATISPEQLVYYRENQVVARELLVMVTR